MIMAVSMDAEEALLPDLQTERVNESRYSRSYSRAEIEQLLKVDMLTRAGVPSYRQREATIAVEISDATLDVRIVVQESFY